MKRITAILITFCLIFEQAGFAQVAVQLGIPGYVQGLSSPEKFRPVHLRYIFYDPRQNDLRILLDKGDKKNAKEDELNISAHDLFRYFLLGLTLPNDSFWVNLRPDSPDDVIDPDLARTDIGKVLLEADVQLKKDTARYTAPDTAEGKQYWSRLYQKANELFASEKIDIPTLTRPWIVPNEIMLGGSERGVYIYKASLKVMLESDYLKNSATYSFQDERLKILNEYSAGLIRELIIPKLNKDVNTAKKYAGLRQVYYSLILAQWFKKQFKNDIGTGVGIDRKELNGLTSSIPWSKDTYFRQYQESFHKGEYNLQGYNQTPYGQTIRQYFSGGINLAQPAQNSVLYKEDFDPSVLKNTVVFDAGITSDRRGLTLEAVKIEKNSEKANLGLLQTAGGDLTGENKDARNSPAAVGFNYQKAVEEAFLRFIAAKDPAAVSGKAKVFSYIMPSGSPKERKEVFKSRLGGFVDYLPIDISRQIVRPGQGVDFIIYELCKNAFDRIVSLESLSKPLTAYKHEINVYLALRTGTNSEKFLEISVEDNGAGKFAARTKDKFAYILNNIHDKSPYLTWNDDWNKLNQQVIFKVNEKLKGNLLAGYKEFIADIPGGKSIAIFEIPLESLVLTGLKTANYSLGKADGGRDEADITIPYDDEIRQAKEFLAGKGYPETRIAGWLARDPAKLLEIAEADGFRPAREYGKQPQADGGKIISFSQAELKEYISAELDEPSVAGIKKTYENLYPDISVYWGKNVDIPVANVVPSKQSRIVLKELAARIMELREGTKKNIVLWKDADINGKVRNFIIDGHHRFAAADILNRSVSGTGERINTLSADVFDPVQKGKTSFSRIEPRSISEINVILPQGDEVKLKNVGLKAVSEKEGVVFEITDGGNSTAPVLKGSELNSRIAETLQDSLPREDRSQIYKQLVDAGVFVFGAYKGYLNEDGLRSQRYFDNIRLKVRGDHYGWEDDFEQFKKQITLIPRVSGNIEDLHLELFGEVFAGMSDDQIRAFTEIGLKSRPEAQESRGSIALNLTQGCSNQCLICGMRGWEKRKLGRQMPFPVAVKVMQRVADKRTQLIPYHDSDPLDYYDDVCGATIADIVSLAEKMNFSNISFLTHGTNLRKDHVQEIVKELSRNVPLSSMGISFHVYHAGVLAYALDTLNPQKDKRGLARKREEIINRYKNRFIPIIRGLDRFKGARIRVFDAKDLIRYLENYILSADYSKRLNDGDKRAVSKAAAVLKEIQGIQDEVLERVGKETLMAFPVYTASNRLLLIGGAAQLFKRMRIPDYIIANIQEIIGQQRNLSPNGFDALIETDGSLVVAGSEDQEIVIRQVKEVFKGPDSEGFRWFVDMARAMVAAKDSPLMQFQGPAMENRDFKQIVFEDLKGFFDKTLKDNPSLKFDYSGMTIDDFQVCHRYFLGLDSFLTLEFPEARKILSSLEAGKPVDASVAQELYRMLQDLPFPVRTEFYIVFDHPDKFGSLQFMTDEGELTTYKFKYSFGAAEDVLKRDINQPYRMFRLNPWRAFSESAGRGNGNNMKKGLAPVIDNAPASRLIHAEREAIGSFLLPGNHTARPAAGRQFSLNDYWDDIQQAVERKEILVYTRQEDTFSALAGGLTGGNTRGLPEETKALFKAYFVLNGQDPQGVDVLVLGAGAGKECADIYVLVRGNSLPINIDTVSLSPIDPRLLLKASSLEIRRMLYEYIQKSAMRSAELGAQELFRIRSLSQARSGIPWETVFELHNNGYPVCDYLDKPFIRRQYIVELNALDIDKKYGLIYDQIGGFWYSVKKDGIQKTIETIAGLLKQEGIFYAENFPEPLDYSSLVIPEGFIGITSKKNDRFLILKKASRIAKLLSGVLAIAAREGGVYKLSDFGQIFKMMGTAGYGDEAAGDNDEKGNRAGKDGGSLKEFLLRNFSSQSIIPVNLWDNRSWGKAITALKDGNIVEIELVDPPKTGRDGYLQARDNFSAFAVSIYGELSKEDRYFRDADTVLLELFKNAFLHGNRLDYRLPIFIRIKTGDNAGAKSFEIYDTASEKALTTEERRIAAETELGGPGQAINLIKWLWDYEREALEGTRGAKVTVTRLIDRVVSREDNIKKQEWDGGLRAYIANKDPGREVVDVDLWGDEYIDPIVDAVRSDKAVALHLSNGAFTLGERGSKLANKLKFICIMLAREFTPVPDMDIQKSILEVMKNAFVHGNKTDMSVPIYLYLKLDDIGWMDALTVYNNTLDAQFTGMEKQLLLNSGWSGRNKGVNNLQRKFKYELLELPDIRACKVTITPGNADQAEAGPDNDGGDKGGIDLRSLSITSQPGSILSAGVNPRLTDMDMDGEWIQIQNMVNSGFIPNMERIRDYAAACCQKGIISRQKEDILLCIADILRIEEDRNLDTDPGIKDLLASIDQVS